jgi:hypothetical protein
VGGGRENGEGEKEGIRSMCFIYLYENRTMKLVELILRWGVRGEGERWRG